jgi:hypothetical protein
MAPEAIGPGKPKAFRTSDGKAADQKGSSMKMKGTGHIIEADKIGSATSPFNLSKTVRVIGSNGEPTAGDIVVVRALTDSATYSMLELPTGRLAKVNPGDVLIGVLGRRRALKGFVGDVPEKVEAGDQLHLLNLGGVIGCCTGHHSSLSDAIRVEVIGLVCDEGGRVANIRDRAIPGRPSLGESPPLVIIAGTSMNCGKTYAATELIQQATRAGLRVAAGKLSGIACLRDTFNMSGRDCELPGLRSAIHSRCRQSCSRSKGDYRSFERKLSGSNCD